MGGDQAEKIATMLSFTGHVRVDARGFSGGIWVYWKKELAKVEPILKQDQYITMGISHIRGEPWYFIAIYASPDPSKRRILWQELKDFAVIHNKPCMLAGDFNETRFSWERNSSCLETRRGLERFNEWVNDMDLLEEEFVGASHTWSRGLSIKTRRSVRPDRALCNSNWGLRFELARVKHLPAMSSDHAPLLISPNGFAPISNFLKPFKFQAA